MGNNFEQSDGSSFNSNDSSDPSRNASRQATDLFRERQNYQADSRMPVGFPDSNSVIAYDNTPNYLQGRAQDGYRAPVQQVAQAYYPSYPTLASVLHKNDNYYHGQVQGNGDHRLTANVQTQHHFNPNFHAQLNHNQRGDHRRQTGAQHHAPLLMDKSSTAIATPTGIQKIEFWTPHTNTPGTHWEGNIPKMSSNIPYYKYMDGHIVNDSHGNKVFQIEKISQSDKDHLQTLARPWLIPFKEHFWKKT